MISGLKYLLMMLVLFVGAVDAQQTFYLYRDHKGNQHMADTVPGEYVRYGYRIVNAQGVTLETVSPQKTRIRGADKNQISSRDKILLKTFQSEEDLEYSRKNKLRHLDQQISFSKNNLMLLRKNLAEIESHRHNDSRGHGDGDDHHHLTGHDDDIDEVRKRIRDSQARLRARNEEYARINAEFSAKLARFRELKRAGY